mgnify:CR=1 FL=1
MKITNSIMTWINRILMFLFLISLLISIIDSSYIFYTMYIAFAVGCFQIFSCLISLFYIKRTEKVKRIFLIIYMFLVAFYFLTWYLLDRFKLNNSSTFFIFYLFSIPILLSIFWTYILESIHKKI